MLTRSVRPNFQWNTCSSSRGNGVLPLYKRNTFHSYNNKAHTNCWGRDINAFRKLFSTKHTQEISEINNSIKKRTHIACANASQEDCENITKLGVYSNLGLFFIKIAAGVYTGSSAMIADAIHSFSDLASDFATFWAVRHSHKPKSDEHPYGYGKFEAIGALTVGGLLMATSVGIMWHSTSSLFESPIPQSIKSFFGFNELSAHGTHILPTAAEEITSVSELGTTYFYALVAAVVSMGVKEVLYHLTIREGRKYQSQVIIANAWHHRSDAISSLVAFMGIGSSMYFGNNIMDSIAGIAVGAMITKLSFSVCKDAIAELTDRQIESPIFNSVAECIQRVEGVKGFHRLRGRKMGPYISMDVHIIVDELLSVTAAHQIAERVKHDVMAQHEKIGDFLVHVDPLDELHLVHDHAVPASYFKRSMKDIEVDIRDLVANSFASDIKEVTHFNLHYVNNSVHVQMEVRMNSSLKIDDAAAIVRQLQQKIVQNVAGVDYADIHLEIL